MKARVTRSGSRRINLPEGTVIVFKPTDVRHGLIFNGLTESGVRVYGLSLYPFTDEGDVGAILMEEA